MASAWGSAFGAAFGNAWGLLTAPAPEVVKTGGGIFKPRKPKPLIKPRPAWMPPILWALPLDEEQNPLIESTTVGDAALYIRKRLQRRQKDEAELLMLGII